MQGVEVSLRSTIAASEDASLVLESIRKLFPSIPESVFGSKSFPHESGTRELEYDSVDIETFLEHLSKQRILDTAMDAMSRELGKSHGTTRFHVSRQAALAGKVAFVLPGEKSLGGVIEVTLRGDDLPSWIEDATHHPGRDSVPRTIDDEFKMDRDGSVSEWFDKEGNPVKKSEV